MDTPVFLGLDHVLQIHVYQAETFGGSRDILDLGKVEAAIAQPRATYGGSFLHEDLAAMAAAYLFHIVQNHGFEDGNKRTGAHAAIIFLELNGYELDVPTDEAEQLVLRVATGEAKKPEVATFFRRLINEQYPESASDPE